MHSAPTSSCLKKKSYLGPGQVLPIVGARRIADVHQSVNEAGLVVWVQGESDGHREDAIDDVRDQFAPLEGGMRLLSIKKRRSSKRKREEAEKKEPG